MILYDLSDDQKLEIMLFAEKYNIDLESDYGKDLQNLIDNLMYQAWLSTIPDWG